MTEVERILKLLEEKKITAEEAAKLLDALEEGENTDKARFLKIKVLERNSGRTKVNVTIPLALVRWGMQFVPESAQMKLNEHNINFDAITQALEKNFQGKLIEASDEDENEHVEVYLE